MSIATIALKLLPKLGGGVARATGAALRTTGRTAMKSASLLGRAARAGLPLAGTGLAVGGAALGGAALGAASLLGKAVSSIFRDKKSSEEPSSELSQPSINTGIVGRGVSTQQPVRIAPFQVQNISPVNISSSNADDVDIAMINAVRNINNNIQNMALYVGASIDVIQQQITSQVSPEKQQEDGPPGFIKRTAKKTGQSLLFGALVALTPVIGELAGYVKKLLDSDVGKLLSSLLGDEEGKELDDIIERIGAGAFAGIKGIQALYKTAKGTIGAAKWAGGKIVEKTGEVATKLGRAALTTGASAVKGASKIAGSIGSSIAGAVVDKLPLKAQLVAGAAASKLKRKGAEKAGEKVAKEVIEEAAKKQIKKSLAKIGLTKIPWVGLAVGGVSALMLQMKGDTTGAALELASGVAGTVPGAGTALSIAADVAQVSRYAYKSVYGVFPEDDEPGQRGERLKEIKDVVEKLIIGSNEEADKVNAEKVKGERDSAWGSVLGALKGAASSAAGAVAAAGQSTATWLLDKVGPGSDYDPNAAAAESPSSSNEGSRVSTLSSAVQQKSGAPRTNNITIPPSVSTLRGVNNNSPTVDVSAVPDPSIGLPGIDLFYAGAM